MKTIERPLKMKRVGTGLLARRGELVEQWCPAATPPTNQNDPSYVAGPSTRVFVYVFYIPTTSMQRFNFRKKGPRVESYDRPMIPNDTRYLQGSTWTGMYPLCILVI